MPHLVMLFFDYSRMQVHSGFASKSYMYKSSNGIVNPMFSSMSVKDECANPVLETNMEGVTLISIQLETITVLAAIALSLATTIEYLKVDVGIEEIEALVMEE